MKLLNIKAQPHPHGHRIDLSWTYPASVHTEESAVETPRRQIVLLRRTNNYPTQVDDGIEVPLVTGMNAAMDDSLRGETVYYYQFFTPDDSETGFTADPDNRASAMATSAYDFGGLLYSLLPTIYRRYDEGQPTPQGLTPMDEGKGVLRRFLDLPGAELDRLYSLARASLDLHSVDRVDAKLLSLLAHWIGWQSDQHLPIGSQRRDIRFAPQLFPRIGTLSALVAASRRVTTAQLHVKEYKCNVARTNCPDRLNLWSVARSDANGKWGIPELVSVNFVFEGRPTHINKPDGGQIVFYHAHRSSGRDIWMKERTFKGLWKPSVPVVERAGTDIHPSAARCGDREWLFWETCQADRDADHHPHRCIAFRTREASETWSDVHVAGGVGAEFFGDPDAERVHPTVAADGNGGLWLFWHERADSEWHIKYNHHDGVRWELLAPASVPEDNDPRISDDLQLLLRPTAPTRKLWLFGAYRSTGDPGTGRWSITYRTKNLLDPSSSDWEDTPHILADLAPDVHDREPAPYLRDDGTIEVFFSSTRAPAAEVPPGIRWSIFATTLTDETRNEWSPTQPVVTGTAANRAPLAVNDAHGTLLLYRSSQPIDDPGREDCPIRDSRYSGTTTFRSGRAAFGTLEDAQTYIYTAPGGGAGDDGRIGRDAIGLFLTFPETEPALAAVGEEEAHSRLTPLMRQFLPANARAVFPRR
ncbi:MAG: hypothetical protein EOP16_00525 [Pseudonocardia sp.]|nr:MAG: hypothetical protein EOP16_00525 [Pseudonocardia sp.]